MNKRVEIFFPSGETRWFKEGAENGYINSEHNNKVVSNIASLANNIVSVMYEDKTEVLYSGFPYILETKKETSYEL